MKKLKQAKGITLVALIVTIVILVILAGISILALTNQGIFAQAQNAKKLTEEKTAEENAILTNYLEQMNAIIGGQVTESIPDGAVVIPINDVTTWLKTGGISKKYSYTTIEQVISDTTCTESLMNNENAMKYLTRSTEFADVICESETAITYLGDSAYVDDTVLNSDIWLESVCNSAYFESVLCDKVPTMTSNTEPEGEAICSSYFSSGAFSYPPYKAFDKVITDVSGWSPVITNHSPDEYEQPAWIGYKFKEPTCIKCFVLTNRENTVYSIGKFKLQASNDGNNWVDLTDDITNSNITPKEVYCKKIVKNSNSYLYYRIYAYYSAKYAETENKAYYIECGELQLYGR